MLQTHASGPTATFPTASASEPILLEDVCAWLAGSFSLCAGRAGRRWPLQPRCPRPDGEAAHGCYAHSYSPGAGGAYAQRPRAPASQCFLGTRGKASRFNKPARVAVLLHREAHSCGRRAEQARPLSGQPVACAGRALTSHGPGALCPQLLCHTCPRPRGYFGGTAAGRASPAGASGLQAFLGGRERRGQHLP